MKKTPICPLPMSLFPFQIQPLEYEAHVKGIEVGRPSQRKFGRHLTRPFSAQIVTVLRSFSWWFFGVSQSSRHSSHLKHNVLHNILFQFRLGTPYVILLNMRQDTLSLNTLYYAASWNPHFILWIRRKF